MRSTTYAKGRKRTGHSGKSYHIKLDVPPAFRPIQNKYYICKISKHVTDTKVNVTIKVKYGPLKT